jgi:Cysteine-rich domain
MDVAVESLASSSRLEVDKEKPEEPEKISFRCSSCGMSESVDYFGKTPPFIRNVELLEETYIMKDPFTAPPSKHGTRSFTEYFIVIGVHCRLCQEIFCKDCSLFYKSSFCFPCAQSEIHQFPLEIQSKIRKEILAIKNRLE